MNKKRLRHLPFVILNCLCLGLLGGCFYKKSAQNGCFESTPPPQIEEVSSFSQIGNEGFLVVIPVCRFTSGIPCIEVQVGDQQLVAKLDLGFSGHVSIRTETLRDVEPKLFVRTTSIYGWKGDKYLEDVYEIPKIQIGNMGFYRPFVNDEGAAFQIDAQIGKGGDEEAGLPQARLGCQLFYQTNLFLNLKNSEVAFCDSVETLIKRGYFTDSFVQLPFELDHGLIKINITLSDRLLSCFLDTGLTWNVLNTEESRSEPMLTSLQVDGKDYGDILLRYLPLKCPIPIDAMLGADFFMSYRVFIDFKNQQIYLARQ